MPKLSIINGLQRKKVFTIPLKKPAQSGLTIKTKDTSIKGSVFNKGNKRSARNISRKGKSGKKGKDMTPKGLRVFG